MIKRTVKFDLRRDFLESNNISREVLAERYQIQKESAGVWLRPNKIPPFFVLLDLAKELECSLSYLLSLSEYKGKLKRYTPKIRLNEILKEKKMYSVELAEKSGASITTIRKYANNEKEPPNISVLSTFADILGVSVDYLLGLTDIPTWEEAAIIENPFLLLEEGEAVRITSRSGKTKYYLATPQLLLIDNKGKTYTQEELKKKGSKIKIWKGEMP